MNSINRKKFLKLSVWGFVATLLPLQEIKALSFISNLKSYNQDDYIIAIEKAKQAKVHFYKKEYNIAENLYLECIGLAPADIRFYDNLQNVYSAQGKWLTIVELFKNALIANPNKIAFYDRAAKSLMRLALTDKVLAEQYRESQSTSSLLEDAKQLYNQAISLAPNKEYLKIGKRKVKRKIDEGALTVNYRIDTTSKERKKRKRRQHKKRYKNFTIDQLSTRLSKIDTKKRNTLYFESDLALREKNIEKEKKVIYRLLIKQYKNANDLDNARIHAEALFNLDNLDPTSLKILRRLYKKSGDYSKLIALQKNYATASQNVFSHLGTMHFIQIAYKRGAISFNTFLESITIGEDLVNNWSLLGRLKVDVADKLAKSYILANNYQAANDIYYDFINSGNKYSLVSSNKILLGYAKTYLKSNDYITCKAICLIALGEINQDDVNLNEVKEFIGNRSELNFKNKIDFYYLLSRTYKKLGDYNKESEVLNNILANDPENKFALKRTA